MNDNEIFIQMGSAEQALNFLEWFREKGFDQFMKSPQNQKEDPASCLVSCDPPGKMLEHGYIEID